MDLYHVWCNLKHGVRDLHFADAVTAYMDYLCEEGLIVGYRFTRSKLGFRTGGLGDFHIQMEVRDLAQLEQAFQHVATRAGEVERLHGAVFACVEGVQTALYRDFPDAVRER